MKVFKLFISFFIVMFLFFLCMNSINQSRQINNLEKEIINLKKIESIRLEQIEEVREENKRYLDSCLYILNNKTWFDDSHQVD